MRTVLFVSCWLLLSLAGAAQSTYKYKKDPAIGIHFSLYDFNTAMLLHQVGLSKTLGAGSITNIGDMQPGLALSFLDGITNHFDYFIRYTGSFLAYPFPNNGGYDNEYLLNALDASVHYKILSDRHWVSPFVSAGVGVFDYKGSFGAYMPLGLGLQVNFFNEAYLLVHLQYQVGVSENAASTFYYSLGVAGSIGSSHTTRSLR
jgi:OOP family OmpA-OmpF porin